MPGGYLIDQTRSIVLTRAWGVLKDSEVIAHARALAADPRFAPPLNQLSDFRDVTEFQVTAATIREMVTLSPFGAGSRRAFVMGADFGFGLARMFEIMRNPSPDEIQVVRDLDSALQWLGVAGKKQALLAALSKVPATFVDESDASIGTGGEQS